MDDRWIRNHARYCCQMHLQNPREDNDVLKEILAMSLVTLDAAEFVERLAEVVLRSTDPDVCEAKKCVEDAILWQIMDDEGEQPLIARAYEPLASAAIAKHLLTIYRSL